MNQTSMIEVLRASAPVPELAEKLRLFGQFVGSWDAKVINYKPDGTSQTIEAEWHFGWVLEGRAIQDVWIAPKTLFAPFDAGRARRLRSDDSFLRRESGYLAFDLDRTD